MGNRLLLQGHPSWVNTSRGSPVPPLQLAWDPRLLSREYEERGQIGKVDAAPLVQRSGSSGRVDNVDALAGVLSTYVLVHVCPLLAAAATVRAFEARSHPALVPKMTLQAFQHAVTVPTFRTHVVLPLPPAQPT